ncbi:MAG: hypothetical protein K1Y36_19065 [Blastocatellia bacterium]|nr:hypothetical protein [Blastocatellia bacterium]
MLPVFFVSILFSRPENKKKRCGLLKQTTGDTYIFSPRGTESNVTTESFLSAQVEPDSVCSFRPELQGEDCEPAPEQEKICNVLMFFSKYLGRHKSKLTTAVQGSITVPPNFSIWKEMRPRRSDFQPAELSQPTTE